MRAAVRTLSVLGPVILGWGVACSDTGPGNAIDRSSMPGLTISAPLSSAVAGALAWAAKTPVDVSPVYVSLAPGSVPAGVTAAIRDGATGQPITAVVENGGFDPVAIHASLGETIVVDITTATGDVIHVTRDVTPRRPPAIIRTDPPPRKRDVPLNAIIVVVFSEPIDASTVDTTSIILMRGSTRVPGTIRFADGAHVSVEFHPAVSLEPSTDYQLVVSEGIRSMNGLPLESALTVPFTTGLGLVLAGRTIGGTASGLAGQGLILRVGSGAYDNGTGEDVHVDANGAFTFPTPFGTGLTYFVGVRTLPSNPAQLCVVANGSGYVASTDVTNVTVRCFGADPSLTGQILFTTMNAQAPDVLMLDLDRSTITHLTTGTDWDYTPQWSPDHSKIAFSRCSQSIAGDWTCGLWVMSADGSGAHAISSHFMSSQGGIPFTWSPDGTRIASFEGSAFTMVNADGSGETVVNVSPDGSPFFGSAAWSPDGSTIAVVRNASPPDDDPMIRIHVMNPDGSNLHVLTSSIAYGSNTTSAEANPAWSPDGTKLAFWSAVYGLTVADRLGTSAYSASHDDSRGARGFESLAVQLNATPDWSRDGRYLVFQMNGQLFVTLADGSGTPRQLTSVPGGAFAAAWFK